MTASKIKKNGKFFSQTFDMAAIFIMAEKMVYIAKLNKF
jgi:hypothetical protein